jgi:uncharacterized protein YfaP (DUF2135 family)
VNEGEVRVTLSWARQSDLDLHVIEPNGTEIFYGNRGPTATGGTLDIDVLCDRVGGVENIRWGVGTHPEPGIYTVFVDQFNECGQGPSGWQLEAYIDGRRVLASSGTGDSTGQLTFVVPED